LARFSGESIVNFALPGVVSAPAPYLVFLGDGTEAAFAKTAFGLRDWAHERCLGEFSTSGEFSIGLTPMTPAEAAAAGARAMVIGVANIGGALRPSWMAALRAGLEAGLDLVSGMHGRLSDEPSLRRLAEQTGRRLIDVRTPPPHLPVATGVKRTGRRLLTVGTDCALGKKYTALSLARAFKARGVDADFRATGQTGILIAGSGIPIDAVVADFVAGAAEVLSPDAAPDHWDVVEGQGSLFHPAYAGVSLGLMHGAQPDCLVLCHQVGRDTILGLEGYATPGLAEAIRITQQLARLTNPAAVFGGVSLNTAALDEAAAATALARAADETGLPAADPIRGGPAFDALVERCLAAGR
jgi:uncharacterized NAD-dependent epimerase/dehydratase family protein